MNAFFGFPARLRALFSRRARVRLNGRIPIVPRGQRLYAIGDVHGRLDLLRPLIKRIEEDDAARVPAKTTIIMLGDLIDRGPDSAGVLSFLNRLRSRRKMRFIMGNHEEMFLAALERKEVLRSFLDYGGRETFLSYAISRSDYDSLSLDELHIRIPALVPSEDVDFIRGFEDMIVCGDYVFVHAGIRPGVELDAQDVKDLRWIRNPFLSADRPCDHVVIHGHSITEDIEVKPGRIGLDTGAYQTGRLSALGLEEDARWLFLSESGSVSCQKI